MATTRVWDADRQPARRHSATMRPSCFRMERCSWRAGSTANHNYLKPGPSSYDPATGAWTENRFPFPFRAPSFTATLLSNGKVLVAGGAAAGFELRRQRRAL